MTACSPGSRPEPLCQRPHAGISPEYLRGWLPNVAETAEYRTHFGDVLTHTTTLSDQTVRLESSDGLWMEISLSGGRRPAGSVVRIHRRSDDFRLESRGERLLAISRDGNRRLLRYPQSGILEEVLPLCARRLAWPRLRLGQSWHYVVLRSNSLNWEPVHLELSDSRHTVPGPAGSFRAHRFTARFADGQLRTWWTEIDPPHRIVRFERSDGFHASLARPFVQVPRSTKSSNGAVRVTDQLPEAK